jgi:Rieske Fe-S protein
LSAGVEPKQFTNRLIEKSQLRVPVEVVSSVYSDNPKIRPLLSRASFRAEAIRTPERVRRERRSFLRNVIGLAIIAVPTFLWVKVAFLSPTTTTPTYVANAGAQSGQKILANASSIPKGQSITLQDPNLGTILLIHLMNDRFVAYSAVCTHAGCQVQFVSSAQEIACPCHGAVYDPANGASVISGPAPYPLPNVPISYDQATGNIYLSQ